MSNRSGSEIQEELHNYLESKNINSLFVQIVEAILVEKPDNVVGWMVNHLVDKYPEETKDLLIKTEKPPSLVVAKKSDEDEELSDTGSDCSSVVTNESVALSTTRQCGDASSSEQPPLRKKRRESVCAEKITDDTVDLTKLKVIPKTDDQRKSILHILKNNLFFSHLDEHQMKMIKDAMFASSYSDGDVIISQGDDGDNFFCIDKGIVEIFIDSPSSGERNLVKTCENGDSFGELAIMYNAPRAASCIAKGDVQLWALDRVSFNVILMKTAISNRTAMKEVLLKIPVFAQLTEYELLTIADSMQEETFGDKSIICNQGDRGDKFYLVDEGVAVCTQSENGKEVEVARLSSGTFFGEIALLTTKPRQATVRAEGTLKCFTLNRKTFNRVMGPLQEILMRNMDEYTKFRSLHI